MNVFDFDKTIYDGDSTVDFFKYCLKKYPNTKKHLFHIAINGIKFGLKILEKTKFKESVGAGGNGRLIPAGVIYVKTAVSDVEVSLPDDSLAEETVKANQKREGMVLNDPEILSAMNLKYTPVYSERTPDKVSSTKEKFLFTEDGFDEIMRTVEGSVVSVADRMRSGRIEAAPKQNGASASLPCEYCEFKPICRSVVKK